MSAKPKKASKAKRELKGELEAIEDQEAIAKYLGMPMPKEIRAAADLLREAEEMTDEEYGRLVGEYPATDKDAQR